MLCVEIYSIMKLIGTSNADDVSEDTIAIYRIGLGAGEFRMRVSITGLSSPLAMILHSKYCQLE